MNSKQIEEILEQVGCIIEPDVMQRHELEKTLQSPGFLVLLSLLVAGRNGHMQMLSNISLATEEERCRASVLQGQIKCVDLIRETLLSLCPSDQPNRTTQEIKP